MIDIDTDIDEPLPDEQVRAMSLIELVKYRELVLRDVCLRMAAQASREIVRRDAILRQCEYDDIELSDYTCPRCGHDSARDGWCHEEYDIDPHNLGAWGTRTFLCCECDLEVFSVPFRITRVHLWS